MLKRLILTTAAATAILTLQPLSAADAAPAAQEQQVLNPKVFEFTDTHGQKIEILVSEKGIKLLNFKGKSAVLMFYIYSGTPCRNELQLFSKLKPELKDTEFVAFELKGLKPDQLKDFEKELKLKGLHLIDTAQAMPFAQFIAQLIKWPGSVPLIIAVTKEGEVKHMQLGAMNEEQVRKLAAELNK